MPFIRPVVIGGLFLTGLTACETPTISNEPSATSTGAELIAVTQQFTIRSLGTLGGTLQRRQRHQRAGCR